MTSLRIAAAQIQHETNVFSSVRTDMAAFRRSGLKFGAEIDVGAEHELGLRRLLRRS